MNPRVFIPTCRPYYWIIPAFSLLFRRYWSEQQEVVVAGYEPILDYMPDNFEWPDNWGFYSIDDKTYPQNRWSDGVIKFLQAMPDELCILMLEDMLLVRTVDVRTVASLADYMMQHKEVVRIDLTTDRLYAGASPGQLPEYGYWGSTDLIWSEPESPYHLSLQASIWRREYLLHYMVPGETPWDLEMAGTTRLSSTPELVVLGTRQFPCRYTLTLKSHAPDKPQITGMRNDDYEELVALGWVPEGSLT